ncbi:MAG TPA: NAD-dependent succinate-semialdehyde dehydrogenase [Gaiellaceae bacterium]|nr:NAD-dependent succinate-semialdehyde dehydrogenase [Gaiellaceae bacterium]
MTRTPRHCSSACDDWNTAQATTWQEDDVSDYAVTNPATGELVKAYPTIGDAELADAIATADQAHREWSRTATIEERAALVRRVGELHLERRGELAEIIVREMGKPVDQALGEVDFCSAIYQYYADNASTLLADEPISLSEGDGSAFVRRSSVGVILGIMPWNYPYYQVARFAGPNLVVGNTILLKHAPQCPESAAAMQTVYDDAGFPIGAYTNIYATNDQIADVIADPRVQGVSVTGSERAGAAVAEIAGRNLKKVVLELGGSDPFVLLSTDDLDGVVKSAVTARLENAGQACNAAKRFVVASDLYEPFVSKLTEALTAIEPGDPSLPDSAMGPLSSATAADRLEDQLRRAVAGGATLVGGTRDGNFVAPGVLTGVTPDNRVHREELFGPVAIVYRVDSEDEAVAVANDTPYGLGSFVFTTDPDQALRVADQIEAGMVFVNVVGADAAELPFGGVKRSGFGRELGRYATEEFVNRKMIRIGG